MNYRSTKKEKFDTVYRAYVDEVYRVCLYYLQDEAKAQEITLQTFLEFYQVFEEVPTEKIFTCLVHMAKEMIDVRR